MTSAIHPSCFGYRECLESADKMPKFETLPHIVEEVHGYTLKVYESDPYYYVKVFWGSKVHASHVISDDTVEFEKIKELY